MLLATKVPTLFAGRATPHCAQVEASLKRLNVTTWTSSTCRASARRTTSPKIEAGLTARSRRCYELRDQKVARCIGMTSHTDGAAMAKAIEQNDLDCVQMAMNPARALQFEELALPAANKKDLGVSLMKVTGRRSSSAPAPARPTSRRPAPLRAHVAGVDRRHRHAEARVRRGEHLDRPRVHALERAGNRSRQEERGATAGGGRSVLPGTHGRVTRLGCSVQARLKAGTTRSKRPRLTVSGWPSSSCLRLLPAACRARLQCEAREPVRIR